MENMYKDLVNAVADCKCGTFIRIAMATIPSMRKKNNPFFGRVTKVSESTYILGNYENVVNRHLEKIGEDPTYDSGSIKGTWVIPNKVLLSTKGNLQLSVLCPKKNANTKIAYFVDGRLATAEETEQILSFCYGHTPVKKQIDAGLQDEELVEVRHPNVSNIIFIKGQGIDYKDDSKALAYAM